MDFNGYTKYILFKYVFSTFQLTPFFKKSLSNVFYHVFLNHEMLFTFGLLHFKVIALDVLAILNGLNGIN